MASPIEICSPVLPSNTSFDLGSIKPLSMHCCNVSGSLVLGSVNLPVSGSKMPSSIASNKERGLADLEIIPCFTASSRDMVSPDLGSLTTANVGSMRPLTTASSRSRSLPLVGSTTLESLSIMPSAMASSIGDFSFSSLCGIELAFSSSEDFSISTCFLCSLGCSVVSFSTGLSAVSVISPLDTASWNDNGSISPGNLT